MAAASPSGGGGGGGPSSSSSPSAASSSLPSAAALDDPREAMAALRSIELAAQFVASDASQLLGGLQASLQTLAHASVDHMTVYRDAAAHTAEHAQEAIATSRSFIEKCQQLDERMRAVGQMKEQLHDVEGALTRLEAAILPRHGPGESGGARGW